MKQASAYGSWPSAIGANLLTQANVRLASPYIDASGIYWLESRPWEGGRSVLVHQPHRGLKHDLLPPQCNVRSRAHEYGGGAYAVADGVVYFVEATDQRIYRFDPAADDTPTALTPEAPQRYADLIVDAHHNRLLAVREDHSNSDHEPVNSLVSVDLQSNRTPLEIASGHDFYSNPQVSPAGDKLCWLCWDHPNMPWDHTQLYVADIQPDGLIGAAKRVAGERPESLFQPRWSPEGDLYAVSDRNNWWNIYRYDADNDQWLAVTQQEAEFATPQWVFGMSTYDFIGPNHLVCCSSSQGSWSLQCVDRTTHTVTPMNLPWTDISQIACHGNELVTLAASATESQTLYHLSLEFSAEDPILEHLTRIIASSDTELASEWISPPLALQCSGPQGEPIYGFYYLPQNPSYTGLENSRPPLIVLCHGGPTGTTESSLNLKIQYWTSRGFAVADINYRGSTGYGRHYRQLLHKHWGVSDVEDVCAAAQFLVDQGLVNSQQLVIKGNSAGGYTTLAALTFSSTFTAGVSLYGIGDLETLATDTHKFESRYLDSLVGPYPETQDLYQQRSPIHHIEQLNCPILFFQGLLDKVVPPDQAQSMVDALHRKGIPVGHVTYENEGHGFRGEHAIRRSLEAEWYFYSVMFEFNLPEEIEPVELQGAS